MKRKPGKIEQQARQLYVSYGYGWTPWQKLRKKYRNFYIRLAWLIHRRLAAAERRGYRQGADDMRQQFTAQRNDPMRRHFPDPFCCGHCEYDEAEGFLVNQCPKCAAKAEKGGGK